MALILHTLRFRYFFEDFLFKVLIQLLGSKSEWPVAIYAGSHGTLLEVGFLGRNCASEVLLLRHILIASDVARSKRGVGAADLKGVLVFLLISDPCTVMSVSRIQLYVT